MPGQARYWFLAILVKLTLITISIRHVNNEKKYAISGAKWENFFGGQNYLSRETKKQIGGELLQEIRH